MADVIVKVLDPADETAGFLSLKEAKVRLGLTGPADPVQDELLQIQILDATATIMRLCNRQFAREEVIETWRGLDSPFVYLTHYPVAEDDIEDVSGRSLSAGGYELEERSGKLRTGGRLTELRVHYTGGYDLPDEAPQDLKYATLLMLRSAQAQATRESVEGIRMIAHKDSRVIFFDPNAQQGRTTTAQSGGAGVPGVDALLTRYTRLWV